MDSSREFPSGRRMYTGIYIAPLLGRLHRYRPEHRYSNQKAVGASRDASISPSGLHRCLHVRLLRLVGLGCSAPSRRCPDCGPALCRRSVSRCIHASEMFAVICSNRSRVVGTSVLLSRRGSVVPCPLRQWRASADNELCWVSASFGDTPCKFSSFTLAGTFQHFQEGRGDTVWSGT